MAKLVNFVLGVWNLCNVFVPFLIPPFESYQKLKHESTQKNIGIAEHQKNIHYLYKLSGEVKLNNEVLKFDMSKF